MVSIKPPSPPAETEAERDEQARYRLIYSKSKVYVHPTAYARDNIPGFISIVKRDAISPTYFLTWVPESLLGDRGNEEWSKFLRVEAEYGSGAHTIDEEEGKYKGLYVLRKPNVAAFQTRAVVQLPTISSWYGSMTFNLTSGATLQTIYFHDEESRSISQLTPKNRAASGIASWGGEDLLQRLKSYCHILRSTLQSNLFLFDPSKPDIEAHTMVLFDDDAADLIMAQSADSPIPHHRRPQRPQQSRASGSGGSSSSSAPSPRLTPNGSPVPFPNPRYSTRTSVLHETLPSYPPTSFTPLTSPSRTSLLQSFSQLTRATRHAAQQILSHPLAQPIVPHLPSPMQSFVNASGEWAGLLEKGGMGEFEAARVYLARWARVVAEEGERARRREARVVGGGDKEEGELGVFELLAKSANLPTPKSTRHPKDAIDKATWLGWFDETGRPKISEEEMRGEVFRRGFSTMEARRLAWPSVLKVLPWDIDEQTREKLAQYEEIKSQWYEVEEVLKRPEVAEERHRVDVDVRRTDRTQPLFALPEDAAANENAAQAASNEHVDRLGTILLSYNFYEKELGYVQGMSDLCAPIYVKQNFLRDQSGMKKQLLTLQQLLSVMDPELYRHLEKADALNLFFCFRWVLIAFKREFPFDDVLRLWEVLWTNYYTNQFVLFVALAVLESHRDFDEILKYCNDLSMTIELDSTLAQAEVLFLSFQQTDIDRRQAEQGLSSSPGGLRRRRGDSRPGSPASLPPGASEEDMTKAVLSMSLISDHLRELLQR
ncbi:unnamed protein product [Rhizoctonia solani]|uniref:Rab-GAP TBC domain-containing protein n=1 Tax=Rhizoctonia solani TaxID=456999 RepID=A0A8H3E8G0_9AGAM|nr:unnamed protein product [Rhizoctonia solani]